jgi:hypothetical protein
MDPTTAAGSGAGVGILLALLNGWLAGRRNRSSLLWFIGSLVLSPVALLLTIYLVAQPTALRASRQDRFVGLAAVALWAVLAVILLSVFLFGAQAGAGGAWTT